MLPWPNVLKEHTGGYSCEEFSQKMRLTPRDRFVLARQARYYLTARLLVELSQLCPQPFADVKHVQRRMLRLFQAGLVRRDRRLTTGEYYYFLSPLGAQLAASEDEDNRFTGRVTNRMRPAFQEHEMMLAHVLVKLELDAAKLKVKILHLLRDGQFTATVDLDGQARRLQPDATVVLRIKGRARLFFFELDRSTERGRSTSRIATGSFRDKVVRYSRFFDTFQNHPLLRELNVDSFRVLTICRSPERSRNLRDVAQGMGKRRMFGFTEIGKLVESADESRVFREENLLSARAFTFPDQAVRTSMLN